MGSVAKSSFSACILMPLISSLYKAPDFFLAGDLQTILPALFRKVGNVVYRRERLTTPDEDFLDLDWSAIGAKKIAILNHGLEGNTQTQYMLGMTRALNLAGWDVMAWNYRSCSGEINKLYRFYHSGETTDLHFVIQHVAEKKTYEEIVLIGFSVGGNITLKYLGEQGSTILPSISKAIAFSVPCDLASGAAHLAKWRSKLYMRRFLKSLRNKIHEKAIRMPDKIDVKGLENIANFLQFDEKYTAPMHGFLDAHDYWKKNSSIFFIDKIRIPTLIVSAANDPFLTPKCFPFQQARDNSFVFLEVPRGGGHCGFYENNKDNLYWSEKRALKFLLNTRGIKYLKEYPLFYCLHLRFRRSMHY